MLTRIEARELPLDADKVIHKKLYSSSMDGKSVVISSRAKKQTALSFFLAEINFLKAAKHPNIAQFIKTHEDPINYYLVLEGLSGSTLSFIVRNSSIKIDILRSYALTAL